MLFKIPKQSILAEIRTLKVTNQIGQRFLNVLKLKMAIILLKIPPFLTLEKLKENKLNI